jgi:hypothetical protein
MSLARLDTQCQFEVWEKDTIYSFVAKRKGCFHPVRSAAHDVQPRLGGYGLLVYIALGVECQEVFPRHTNHDHRAV